MSARVRQMVEINNDREYGRCDVTFEALPNCFEIRARQNGEDVMAMQVAIENLRDFAEAVNDLLDFYDILEEGTDA